ncbi:hypothetical protein SESBI_21065 [Sesbania bispinosa]|nr:hypothetical protein SESBI_21065 [Sesbania bispinosa]
MERLDSNQYQGMVEDQDNTSNAPKAKKSIRITTTDNNLERLVEITKSMSKEMRRDFDKMYGRILDLLDISVKTPVISALAQFWSSDLHCFELPNLDLVPTIEEYTRMTRLPIDDNVGVYSYRGRYVDERKIAKLIGLHPDQLKLEKRGAIQGLRKSFLEDHLEALAGRGSWHYFNKTLALTIYGLYETQGLNPVPAILADTLLTLEVCQKKNGGTLKCCTHLLYVWIITHMYACELRTLFPDPLRDFGRIKVKRQEAREWKKELADIQDNKIAWTCPWYSPYEYDAPDVSQLLVRVRAAWRNVQRKGDDELGKPRVSASQEYNEWRRARGVPEYVLREAPHAEGSSRSSDETLKAMASELERARAQIKQLEEVEEAAEWEIDALKRQCKKKDEQIEQFEDPGIEALEKENAEILEGKLALEAENQTQGEHLKKLLAELADARNDTKNWWGLAKNYHEKNEELSQKVIKRKLKAKRKKQEADEAIEGWRLRTNVQRDKKKEWMKRCDDMADCVNYHSIELARRLGEAEDEIDRNPEIQLPPKTASDDVPHHQAQAPQGVQWPLYGLPPGYAPPVLTNPPDNHAPATNPDPQSQMPQGVQWPTYGLPPGYTPPQLTNPQDNNTTAANTDPQNQAQQLDPGQTTNETSAPPPPFPTFMPYPFLPTTNTPSSTFQPPNFNLDSQGKPIIPQPVPLLVSTTQPKDTVVNDPHSKEKLQILEDRLRAIEGKKKEGETHAVTFEHNNTFQARPGYAPTHFQPNFQPPYMPYPYGHVLVRDVTDIKTPMELIFEELCKIGAIEKKRDSRKGAMCAIHPDAEHSIEKCEKFKEVLQSLIDSQLVQISCIRDEGGVNVVQESGKRPNPSIS